MLFCFVVTSSSGLSVVWVLLLLVPLVDVFYFCEEVVHLLW